MSDLWTAYRSGDEALAPFFAHRPGNWDTVIEARNRHPVAPFKDDEIEEIYQANKGWAVDDSIAERARMLADPGTRVIVTGQQPGLLGGPLYTLYKAIAVVRWADRIEREHNLSVLPLFWVASEDHDFDEVRWVRWRTESGEWMRYEYSADAHRPGMPVHDIPIEPSLMKDLREIFGQTRETEFTTALIEWLESIAGDSNSLENFFVRIIAGLLGERSPLFVTPRMRFVRRRGAAVLERELNAPGESSRRVIEAGRRLAELGYETALHRKPEDVNFFVYRDGLRCKVTVAGDRFEIHTLSSETQSVASEDLRAELKEHPEHFSFNVVTRAVASDAILPTLAYIGGPGEIAYLAQLREAFAFFETEPAMFLPRPQAALIEPRVERALEKINLSVSDVVQCSDGEFQSKATEHSLDPSAEKGLESSKQRMNETLAFIREQVDLDDPAVAKAFKKLAQAAETGLDKLAERQEKAVLRRDDTTQRAIETVRENLWPEDVLQERALTIFFPFLNLFGKDLPRQILDAIDPGADGMQPIVISSLLEEKGA